MPRVRGVLKSASRGFILDFSLAQGPTRSVHALVAAEASSMCTAKKCMRQSSPSGLLFTVWPIMVKLGFQRCFHIQSSPSRLQPKPSVQLQTRAKTHDEAILLTSSLWLLALQPTPTFAYWRMACSVSQTSRADPIVDPGTVSGHVHKFAGGNSPSPF